MMTFLRVTNSLKLAALVMVIVSLTSIVCIEVADIWNGCTWSSCTTSVYTKSVYLEDANIRDTFNSETYIRVVYIKGVFTRGIYFGIAFTRASTYIKSACAKSTYSRIVNTVEHLGIDS